MTNYLKGYSMFLDYLGINENKLNIISNERLMLATTVNTHNRLRLMRVLSSLHIFGFHDKAFELCRILKSPTYKHIYEKEYKFYDKV
jgi:hypothetical protein